MIIQVQIVGSTYK